MCHVAKWQSPVFSNFVSRVSSLLHLCSGIQETVLQFDLLRENNNTSNKISWLSVAFGKWEQSSPFTNALNGIKVIDLSHSVDIIGYICPPPPPPVSQPLILKTLTILDKHAFIPWNKRQLRRL